MVEWMGTEVRSWQILDGKLVSSDMALMREGRTEPYDLEPWMAYHPESIEADMMIIGGQVTTTSGRIDLFGTDERPFETAN